MTTQDVVSESRSHSCAKGECSKVDEVTVAEARKLSSSTDDGSIQEFHQLLPEGVEIRKISYGHGLFATKFFHKGSVVYTGHQIVIPNKFAEFRLIIGNRGGAEYLLDTETHTVEITETDRWLYLFDSFMNHCCAPTAVSRSRDNIGTSGVYDMVALVDIHSGDEITCDYNAFEYDAHGKVIENCYCGSLDCIGRVAGYRFLQIEEQKKRLSYVDDVVLKAMSVDPHNKFYYIPDLHIPTDRVSVELCPGELGSYKIVASRDFTRGEIIYSNESLLFPEDCSIVIEVNGGRMWLDNLVHTVNKGSGTREFYYFDSFQNHACDPNSEMIYHSDSVYDTIALRDIKRGEEITSDYESFDSGIDGTSFMCKCGSSNCRGLIRA